MFQSRRTPDTTRNHTYTHIIAHKKTVKKSKRLFSKNRCMHFMLKLKKNPLHLPIPFILVCLNTIQKNISRLLWSLVRRCIGTGLTFIIITRLLHFCTFYRLYKIRMATIVIRMTIAATLPPITGKVGISLEPAFFTD